MYVLNDLSYTKDKIIIILNDLEHSIIRKFYIERDDNTRLFDEHAIDSFMNDKDSFSCNVSHHASSERFRKNKYHFDYSLKHDLETGEEAEDIFYIFFIYLFVGNMSYTIRIKNNKITEGFILDFMTDGPLHSRTFSLETKKENANGY